MATKPYSENLDILVAVVTHIAVGEYIKRTASGIASEAQLEPAKVERVLNCFPGLFKKYKDPTRQTNEDRFTLHVLHAGQWLDGTRDDSEPIRLRPYGEKRRLDPQYLTVLLEFISHRAQDEALQATSWRTALLGFISGVVGGTIGAIGAVLAVLLANKPG